MFRVYTCTDLVYFVLKLSASGLVSTGECRARGNSARIMQQVSKDTLERFISVIQFTCSHPKNSCIVLINSMIFAKAPSYSQK